MKHSFLTIVLFFEAFGLHAQVQLSGEVKDQSSGMPLPFATILAKNLNADIETTGTFAGEEGFFLLDLDTGQYQLTVQMVGYQNHIINSFNLTNDHELGIVQLKPNLTELSEVVVRTERSYVENDLGKRTLHVRSDLANVGASALNALESLPAVTTTLDGNVSVRGSENVIIYINGKETNRNPRTLQFIPAESLQKIELITNPSAKYDAEGVAGIINLIYARSISSKLEVFLNPSFPTRFSGGMSGSISSNRFSFYLNANERVDRSKYSQDQTRLAPEDSLEYYVSNIFSNAEGSTRDIETGIAFELDSTWSFGLDLNYLRWEDDMVELQSNTFRYPFSSQFYQFENSALEIEDELTLSFSAEKRFSNRSIMNLLLTSGGEDEINRTVFNRGFTDVSDIPELQPVQQSDETEDQRFHRVKLDYVAPLTNELELETGFVFHSFNYNVNQNLIFSDASEVANLFQVLTNKHAVYGLLNHTSKRFEYSLGIRFESYKAETIERSTDSTFVQLFENLFPSVQWKYTLGEKGHSIGFNLTRRINRPSFWEMSPFLSYTDPLNIRTGNPYLIPEFAYLYELMYANSIGDLSFDLTLFKRRTENVIQRFAEPFDDTRLLVSFRNQGVQENDGIELGFSWTPADFFSLDGSASGYRTSFSGSNEEVFFQNKMNWQGRLRQRFKFDSNWTIDLSQYFRARRYGIQSFTEPRYYASSSIQKTFMNQRLVLTLSLSDVFDTNYFGTRLVGEEFQLESRDKWQTQRLTFGFRYKLKQ